MPLSSIDVKRLNRINLYRAVLREDSVSRNDLASMLGLSLPTVSQNVKDLLEKGLIREIGTLASTGGRKAGALSPLANARVALGVDITRNHVCLAAVNLKGELLVHRRSQTKFENKTEYYKDLAKNLESFVDENELSEIPVVGVGMSLPGIISEDGATLLNSHILSITKPLWIDMPWRFKVPTRLFKDALAACRAEQWPDTTPSSFFFLSLSNSVGGALVIDGKILHGDNQRTGEVGHMCVDTKGLTCYCGGIGHYDSYGSALNLAVPGGGRLEGFFGSLLQGNQEFSHILSAYLDSLALMVVNLRMCLDLDIVIGGYVGGFLEPFITELRHRVSSLDSFENNAEYIRLGRHKMEGAAVGAALYFIDAFIKTV
ncbi:MAG: ROK family transcriptional regulator [Deltaproteobacteria bacterium]|jgi:predicted NBD/HSP70 family sugar kinase|nr:ROK family transcriptional regulator [Deltaproteobacteria bacterium]